MATAELVRSQFSYDASTGILSRNGSEAGWLGMNGYRYVSVGNQKYLVHRIIWLWVHGEWPAKTIDHINRNPLDNRLCNLRDVDMTVQGFNHKIYGNNTSGHRNVYFHKPSGLWVVIIWARGVQKSFGYFKKIEDAVTVRDVARKSILAGVE